MRSSHSRHARTAALALLAVLATLTTGIVTAAPALAVGTDRYVATTGDDTDNDCTDPSSPCEHIEHAIEVADSNDIIHVAGGTYDEAEIGIEINLTIEGATDGTTKVDGAGEGIFGVFGTSGDGDTFAPTVTFKDMDISGNTEGEGILATIADVHLIDSHVDRNLAGGVIADDATVEASGSTFSGNGDSEEPDPFTGSGLIVSTGAATVDHSTFDANVGAGIIVVPTDIFEVATVRPQAANDAPASVNIDHSTVSNNGFGGILSLFGSIQTSNVTVAGNTTYGIANAGGIADVAYTTITGTKAPATPTVQDADPLGAGIVSQATETPSLAPSTHDLKAAASRLQRQLPKSAATSSPRIARRIAAAADASNLDPGQTAVTGTIVADQDGVPDCLSSKGAIVDNGYNLSSDADNSCGLSGDANDVTSTEPQLGPLADNGGPTLTELPKKGSPAIDAIPVGSADCTAEADDQRGVSRPQGSKCDMGAVEADQPPVVIAPSHLPHGKVGHSYSVTLTATGGLGAPYVFSLVPSSGPLPDGLTLDSTGKISGTPTEAGSFPITVSVDDPTTKNYTIVIAAPVLASTSPASNPSSSAAPIANTGANVTPLTAYGLLALVLGGLLTLGGIARYAGRHRAH